MNKSIPHILIVDDVSYNREIITTCLEDYNYHLSTAQDGASAWAMLASNPMDFDVILLDREMPNMDGMEVLGRIKKHPVLQHCPVILQTARSATQDIVDGMQAGAYYYLTKPLLPEMLRAIVDTAVHDRVRYVELQEQIKTTNKNFGLLKSASFRFQNLVEVRGLSTFLAPAFDEPASVVLGLSELMINAVEHGNLEISYDEKTQLNSKGIWEKEVNRRLKLNKNMHKYAEIKIQRNRQGIQVIIDDQGKGFDWEPFMEMMPQRAMDNHGRGIALSKITSFPWLEYKGNGNRVCAFSYVP